MLATVDVADEAAHDRGQFGPHCHFSAGVPDCLKTGSFASDTAIGSHLHEAVAHHRHDTMRRIPGGGDRADDRDAAGPGERLPAIGSDVAFRCTLARPSCERSGVSRYGTTWRSENAGRAVTAQSAIAADCEHAHAMGVAMTG